MSESTHDTCFILMPFRKPFTDYYEVLKPSLEKLGLKVHKADEMPGVGIILKDAG